MMALSGRRWVIIAAIALVAIAAWPFLGAQRANATYAYYAPVQPDYVYRDKTIAFYEKRMLQDSQDQISARILASQYLQRYRENLDVGDLQRGLHQGFRSLQLQPEHNAVADEVIGSGYYALHEFRQALTFESRARSEQSGDPNAPAQMALLEMEIGHYASARHDLMVAWRIKDDPSVWTAQARYDEMTGNLARAKTLMQRAAARADEISDNSAESRAWYHYRLGQIAFSAGDSDQAKSQERIAITDFPGFEMAYRALARFCWGLKEWQCALDAAQKGVNIVPEPETLGYLTDAHQALGDVAAAKATQELIFVVERIGNAYRINDRLLSVYYSEHNVRLDDSLRIARREVAKRGNEIEAQDTLAWAAAMDGHWTEAYHAMLIATHLHTQDPRVLFHAGMIEEHFGHRARARQYLKAALDLNPQFDPFYADLARRTYANSRAEMEYSK